MLSNEIETTNYFPLYPPGGRAGPGLVVGGGRAGGATGRQ